MKGYNKWSYAPYRPPLTEVGDVYISRVVPRECGIYFEWLCENESTYTVFYRERGAEDFVRYCDTKEGFCDISGLTEDTDYEFYVAYGDKKSRVRIARCGASVGTVVNYLHPDDPAYSFSGRYLASPSIVRHPDGYLLASMDLYEGKAPQNLVLIFRSDDDGKTWHYVSELTPCFWADLFIHKGELYVFACSTEYGDLLIGKSTDGGKTFGTPVTVLRGSNGKNGNTGVHKNPQNFMYHNGRIYRSMEWGSWGNKVYGHAAMVASCPEDADLLDPESWSFSEPVPFPYDHPDFAGMPTNTMTIEGTLVKDPSGKLLNIMRFGKYHKAIVYEVNTIDPEAPLTYVRQMDFPANYSKFTIKYDSVSGYYYTICTRVWTEEKKNARNLLSFMRSRDLVSWELVCDIFDRRDADEKLVGFQYVMFEMEGDDIIFLCRTAINGAHTFHDSNYMTFHGIKNFRTSPTVE